MKNNKSLITLLIGITIGISIMGIVVCFTVDKLNLVDKVYTAKVNEPKEEIEQTTIESKEIEEEKISEPKEEKTKKEEKATTSKSNKSQAVKKQEEKKETNVLNESLVITEPIVEKSREEVEFDIVNYAQEVETEIINEENINNALKKAKQDFITIIDFIFYGTEIDGYTFNDLTEQTKLQLMSIAMRIDAKLEEYKPGYKEAIKLKINDIENKLTIKYLEVSDKICTKMGSVACNQAKQDLLVLKEDINLTIDWLKVLASNSLSSLDSWYQIFKNSN